MAHVGHGPSMAQKMGQNGPQWADYHKIASTSAIQATPAVPAVPPQPSPDRRADGSQSQISRIAQIGGASESTDRLDSRTGHPLATTDRRIRGGAALYPGVGSARLTTDFDPCNPPDPWDDLVHTDCMSMITPRTLFPGASIHKSQASLLVKITRQPTPASSNRLAKLMTGTAPPDSQFTTTAACKTGVIKHKSNFSAFSAQKSRYPRLHGFPYELGKRAADTT
jgi:hypothetical protein